MAEDADEFALFYAEGGVFEDGEFTPLAIGIALGELFNAQERFSHFERSYSLKATARCSRPNMESSSMPTMPITRMEKMTEVRSRLFHSFQT